MNAVSKQRRALGVDPGSRRIGVALSDASGTIASPLTVVQRTGSARRDLGEIAQLADEYEASVIVVGLPIGLSGHRGPAAKAAQRDADLLATLVTMPVEMHDERFTTVTAERLGRERGRRPDRRTEIDKMAAAVMLQSWLDGREERDSTEQERR